MKVGDKIEIEVDEVMFETIEALKKFDRRNGCFRSDPAYIETAARAGLRLHLRAVDAVKQGKAIIGSHGGAL